MRILTRTLAAALTAAALLPACRLTAPTAGALAAGRAPRWEAIGSSREGRPVKARHVVEVLAGMTDVPAIGEA